jgi:hypothetical protein
MTLLQASHRCLEVRLSGGGFDGQSQLIYRYSLLTADGPPDKKAIPRETDIRYEYL